MIHIHLDRSLQSELFGVDDAQLYDASGRPLGHFLSEELYRRLIYDWANAQISDEELQRRLQKPGGRKLADILAQLQQDG